ncbi:hypothetical protein Lal_00005010 [Lupinus albus]|nr:hypothetical protein Lal_00005010 [Lupinus albus]
MHLVVLGYLLHLPKCSPRLQGLILHDHAIKGDGVIHNHVGLWLSRFDDNFGTSSSIQAELLTIKHDLELTWKLEYRQSRSGSRPDPTSFQQITNRFAPNTFSLNHNPPNSRSSLLSVTGAAVLRFLITANFLQENYTLRHRCLSCLPPLLHFQPILHHNLLLRRNRSFTLAVLVLVLGVNLHQQRRFLKILHNLHHRLPHPLV